MDVLTSVDPTSSQPASSDPFQPSFFELSASTQLSDLLKPALRYVLAVLAQRNPRYLLRLVNSFDELYALLMGAVELHYLRVWGSSFAENFYGLRRRRRPGLSSAGGNSVAQAQSERLRRSEVRESLVFLVALPYVGAKLDDFWERNGGGLSNSSTLFGDETARRFDDSSQPRIRRIRTAALEAFKTTYPYLKTVYQLWLLTYNVRYLFDKTPYWRPWLQLMRVDVRRVGPNDGPRQRLLPTKLPSLVRQPARFFSVMMALGWGGVMEGLKYGLPASIFFFKFLEWWFGADNPRRRRTNAGSQSATHDAQSATTLDPPTVLKPDPSGILSTHVTETYKLPAIYTLTGDLLDKVMQGDSDPKPTLLNGQRRLVHNSCPICGALPINNPAVLPTGYVFCYTCAFEWVDRERTCPVTGRSVVEGKEALRKVLG